MAKFPMKACCFFTILLVLSTVNGKSQDLTNIKFTVTESPEWSSLFQRTNGWFGGDGIYSIPLNGKENKPTTTKTLFIFSDSMIGKISNGKLEPGAKMIHNSTALLTGSQPDSSKIKFYYQPDGVKPETLFHPQTPKTQDGDYYWLGDGFVNTASNNDIFIFGYRIKAQGEGAFGFKEVGNTLIKIKNEQPLSFNNYTQKDTPFYLSDEDGEMGSFGAGIYVNTEAAGEQNPDGYLYIYGTQGKTKKLLVARVLPKDFENDAKWNFWDGQQWQSDIKKSAGVTDQVSNELSVSQLADGRYALIFQQSGIGRHVAMRLGKTPYGPFGPIIKLWDTTPALQLKSFFSYNAKAHPNLSNKGELLISYNVNSFDFLKDLNTHPQLYRPRFITVKFQ